MKHNGWARGVKVSPGLISRRKDKIIASTGRETVALDDPARLFLLV